MTISAERLLKVKDDHDLIRRCQAGDKAAFDALLKEQYDVIYRVAYRWCGDQHHAQDIAQLACIKLAKSIHQFRFEASFSSWLYRLVINCAKDFLKSPNQGGSSDESIDDYQASHQERYEQRQYMRQILEHISQLPSDLRDTLILVFGQGLSHSQVAQQLTIKESTVSWRVHEARKILKQTFSSTSLNDSEHARAGETARGAV